MNARSTSNLNYDQEQTYFSNTFVSLSFNQEPMYPLFSLFLEIIWIREMASVV